MPKRYDETYFRRWYRNPVTRLITPADTRRKLQLAVAAAEYLLERPVRSLLDLGAGEGGWQPALRVLRPRARYVGVDPSEYAVRRFGRRRNLRLGRFGALDSLGLDGPFDVIACVGVLNYLDEDELERGLTALAARLGGVAFLELWATEDETVGDRAGWRERGWRASRRLFTRHGLVPVGLHCYAAAALADRISALERAG